MQIQENPYLQYFCGYSCFDDSKPPFDASLMVHFRKRITPEVLAEIKEMIIAPTRLEYQSFDAYNEATKLQEMIEGFRVREGHYPSGFGR